MKDREFDIFFRKHYLALCMYALRIVGDAEASRDVVEEGFARMWQQVNEGVEINYKKAYIYRVVYNECVSWLRRARETESLDAVVEPDDEAIDTSERDAALWRAIDELPEMCRRVFLLSKRDGLSNAEIAEELGISVKTVKNHMTKAFTRLREALNPSRKPFFLPFL